MSFNSESEHLGAVCETACNFPLMKLSGQYSEESRVKHISVKEIKKLEENANEKKKKNESNFVSLKEIEESGLKSLLDEAYSYKSPKDRVGKSPLFQELLNQVEENDVNKKVADRSKEFVAEAKTNTATENEHDLMNDKVFPGHILGACDKVFPSNILGACDKEKKKKNHKRDSSSSNNGSRKSRFNHLLSITHDGMGASNGILIGNGSSQSASSFSGGAGSTNAAATATATAIASTGNSGAAKHFHVGSRRLPRAQQTLSTRMANSKATSAFLTSSSNIDVPTVTTYNKQPIMTPALVPSAQQPSVSPQFWAQDVAAVRIAVDPDCSWSAAVKDGREIEMKVLRRNTSDDGSADADADADANANENDDDDDDDNDNDDDGNKNNDADDDDDGDGDGGGDGDGDGDGDDDDDDGAVYNYTTHASLEIANVAPAKDSDARHSSILFPSQSSIVLLNGSVDNVIASSITRCNVLSGEKEEIDSVIATNDTPSHHIRSSTRDSSDTSRRLYDDSAIPFGQNYAFMKNTPTNKDYLESSSERKAKPRKPKKPPQTSILSENIEGYCGDKSISYLLEYIENTTAGSLNVKNGGGGGCSGSGSGSAKSKTSSGVSRSGVSEKHRGKASTDDDIRPQKRPPSVRAKERLKKSTSLEDLRHVKNGGGGGGKCGGKKQSSMDDGRFMAASTSTPIIVAQPSSGGSTEASTAVPATATATTNYRFSAAAAECLYPDSSMLDDDSQAAESEFHLVTKKQRKKKRHSKSGTLPQSKMGDERVPAVGLVAGTGAAYKRPSRSFENRHRSRRKSVSSAVPCDKISDTDSIHSLPASSTTPKCKVKKKSTSSGCTPQASYADIAKSPQCSSSTMLSGCDGDGDGDGDDDDDDSKWRKNFVESPCSSSSTSSSSSSFSSSSSSSTTTSSPSCCALPKEVCSYSSVCSSNTSESTCGHTVDTRQLVRKCEENRVEFDDDNCDRSSLTKDTRTGTGTGTGTGICDHAADNHAYSPCIGRVDGPSECGVADGCADPRNSHDVDARSKRDDDDGGRPSCGLARHGVNDLAVHQSDCNRDVANVDATSECGRVTRPSAEIDDRQRGGADVPAASASASRRSKKKRNDARLECVVDADPTLGNGGRDDDAADLATEGGETRTTSAEANDGGTGVKKTASATPLKKCAASKTTLSEDARGLSNKRRGLAATGTEEVAGSPNAYQSAGLRVRSRLDVEGESSGNCDRCPQASHDGDGDGDGGRATNTNSTVATRSCSALTVAYAPVIAAAAAAAALIRSNKQQSTIERTNSEKSGKYNVTEVIQFVNRSWDEVMKTLSSAEVTDARSKVRYYSAK